jgi:hypothetical protein
MRELDDLEKRLHEFRPRRPAAIPDERLQRLRGPIWLGVAAGVASAMFITSRLQKQAAPNQQAPAVTLGALNALVDSPEALDAALTQISRTTLPDVTQPGRALQPLSKF